MKIQVTFDKPTGRYWDKRKNLEGTFEPEPIHNLSDKHTCFGCWELNHWFNVKTGRSDKETTSRALRYLKTHTRIPAKFEVID